MKTRRVGTMLAVGLLATLFLRAVGAAPSLGADEVEEARLAIRTKQFPRAVELLQQRALAGNPDAQYLLGLARWNGIGTTPDRDAALVSLRGAANHGVAAAAYALAALLGTGTDAERKEALEWLSRAASAGYTPALALQSAHTLALRDGRLGADLAADLRFEIARSAARDDDAALLAACGGREFARRRAEFGRTLLFDAAGSDSLAAATLLIGYGAEVDAQNDFGETPLMIAASRPSVAVTRLLLASVARPDVVDKVGRTALFRAAMSNQPGQVALLLAAGSAVDHEDERGWTAVDQAQRSGSAAALQRLLAGGGHPGSGFSAAPHVVTGIDATRTGVLYQGWPPIAIAAVRDDVADIRRRVAAGAQLEARTPGGETALQVAIEAHAGAATRALIELGALRDRAGPDGLDALDRIVRSGDAALIADLAGLGVKLADTPGANGWVGMSVRRGDAAMARALLSTGLSAAAADATGLTPLMYAARAGNVEMLKMLLDRGATPDVVDKRGQSALHLAASAGSSAAVAVLLAVNVKIDLPDRDGATPLIAAIRSGSAATVERLLAAGALVDGREPALNAAAAGGRADIIAAVLVRKPPIDAVDGLGETALMAAARNGDEATSVRLVSAGANLRLRNRERATAADIAEARGYAALAKRLKD